MVDPQIDPNVHARIRAEYHQMAGIPGSEQVAAPETSLRLGEQAGGVGAPVGERTTAVRNRESSVAAREETATLREEAAGVREKANEGLVVATVRAQRMAEDAEQANHLKDEFLATVSHELRTPLNAVMGWARMLGSKQLPPDRAGHGSRPSSATPRL